MNKDICFLDLLVLLIFEVFVLYFELLYFDIFDREDKFFFRENLTFFLWLLA